MLKEYFVLAKMALSIIALLIGQVNAFSQNPGVTPLAAFQTLKSLEGLWVGTAMAPDGPKAAVEYRLTAGGNVVMEVFFPGTSHEMISMYHLDGENLVLKHYCAMGNQPEMALDGKSSTAGELRFVFTGGTNLNPAKDAHIHDGHIGLKGPDRLENAWSYFENGKKKDSNRFYLTRNKSN